LNLAQDSKRSIADLPLLPPAERHQFYKEWSSLSVCYPQQPIFAVIENHATQQTEKRAVSFNGQHLTYAEPNQKTNQLAYYLNQLGVRELGKSEKSLVAYIMPSPLQTPNKAEIRLLSLIMILVMVLLKKLVLQLPQKPGTVGRLSFPQTIPELRCDRVASKLW
jgi:non-ribosomal peptide synthetase component E (peptide arylation enzyme)